MSTLYVDTINEKTSGNGVQIPGHVVQVVQARSGGSAITTTSGSDVDTGVAVTITPLFATSKILITAGFTATSSNGSQTGGTLYTLYRNGTTNLLADTVSNHSGHLEYNSNSGSYAHSVAKMSYLDSPSTTSATTYGIYFRLVGSGAAALQMDWGGVTMIAMEIGG